MGARETITICMTNCHNNRFLAFFEQTGTICFPQDRRLCVGMEESLILSEHKSYHSGLSCKDRPRPQNQATQQQTCLQIILEMDLCVINIIEPM
jgi:hypothetical protein